MGNFKIFSERIKNTYRYRTGKYFSNMAIIYLKGKAQKEAYNSDSFYYKNAYALNYLFENIEKKIFPEDFIVGWIPDINEDECRKLEEEFDRDYKIYWEEIKRGGQSGHFAPNYKKVLKTGIKNIYYQVCGKLSKLNPAVPEDIEKIEFLSSVKITLEGFKKYCEEYSEIAKNMAEKESDREMRYKFYEISEICKKVPWEPAESFHEALQSILFIYLANKFDIPNVSSLGRLDRYLDEYLENDLNRGKITWEKAITLMCNFFAKTNMHYNSPDSVMIGGRTSDGKPYFTKSTQLIIDAVDINRLYNPSLGIAICKDTDNSLLLKAMEMIADGFGHPSFYSDETITQGLLDVGVDIEDACEFVHSTCTEITIPGKSYNWVTADYINFPKVFEYIWYRGKDRNGNLSGIDTGEISELDSFDKFFEKVKEQIAYQVYKNAVDQNHLVWRRMIFDPKPFSSAIVDDCIKREKDITRGGAVYNFLYPQLVGLANVVDSLISIKKYVYDEKKITLEKFKEILEKNYDGFEYLRQEIINKLPKYGTDNDEVDKHAVYFFNFFCDEVLKYRTPLSRYYPGFLVWKMHLPFGLDTMATPDGRKANTPLADSLAGMQGRAKEGITGILKSVEKLNLKRAIGAATVNLHIDSSILKTRKDKEKFVDLIKTHFSNGGFQIQVTVLSKEVLIKAKNEPEKYRDLMVRVGGYSDFFTRLEPELQETIIERARK